MLRFRRSIYLGTWKIDLKYIFFVQWRMYSTCSLYFFVNMNVILPVRNRIIIHFNSECPSRCSVRTDTEYHRCISSHAFSRGWRLFATECSVKLIELIL